MGLRKDIWRPAIVAAPLAQVVARGTLAGFKLHWLPESGAFRFLADPFGHWQDGLLHVFAETYDYRVRVGAIEVLSYDAAFRLRDRRLVLAEPWHLSYPIVFAGEGSLWMLPEAHRSGGLTLYRAVDFPTRWAAAHRIELDHVAVDATPLWHEGRWWLFYASASREADKMGTLHAAHADRLAGPWTPHPQNPIRRDIAGARPGGTACMIDGRVMLPVQDCSRTYGGAVRPLWFDRLDPGAIVTTLGAAIVPTGMVAPYGEGMHTLASAGPVTLIDVKRTELSLHGLSIEAIREGRKLVRRLRG